MDTIVEKFGAPSVAYGPRVLAGTHVEPPTFGQPPEFWGVYEREGELWKHVADAPTEEGAKRLALLIKNCGVDQLDIAYLAIGAVEAWDGADPDQRDKTCNLAGMGQSEFIDAVINVASVLRRLWAEYKFDSEGFPGNWYYEVSEEVGRQCMRCQLDPDAGDFDVEQMVREVIEWCVRRDAAASTQGACGAS